MAITNFAALTAQQKIVWSRDLWSNARDQMFIKRFIGSDGNNVIQRITDLTRTERGEQVLMHLVADLVDDGVAGDNPREGSEEAMQSYNLVLNIDLLAHQVRNKGKLADQKTIINFREQARDKLAYWLANRLDQLAFLTLSGVAYSYRLDGVARVNSQLPQLAFAADVSAPSANRYRRWKVGSPNQLLLGDTTAVAAVDVPGYEMIVQLIAYAKTHYVKPLTSGGKEYYVLFVHPRTLAKLKLDPQYLTAVVNAGQRGPDNPFFTGGIVTVDGAVIHEHRLVYNTLGAASGSKWGAGSAIDGSRTLLCGAQALGMADLGAPDWVEELFDFESKQGISVDKMFGFRKPKFFSPYDNAVEDFGIVACDHAI
ncbi:MAG TPA: N4-gp56 family major capsid protein [Candidatus Contendobacter sp.]|nr:N4-gp56 family major capsid protein [Candidatus Contendobacter sp.]HRD50286.1 N4-gp56 family major capsid protein [Candidatus Contendobacter sp.]